MSKPLEISLAEWQEIITVQEVRETWGLTEESAVEDFASQVYGAKFNFVSGSPGYVGDLYIIQSDVLTGDAPLILGRYEGKLRPVYD